MGLVLKPKRQPEPRFSTLIKYKEVQRLIKAGTHNQKSALGAVRMTHATFQTCRAWLRTNADWTEVIRTQINKTEGEAC